MLNSMYSKFYLFLLFSLCQLICCTKQSEEKPLRWLEDIRYDKKMDKKDFTLCSEDDVYQYFNLGNGIHYEGDKPGLVNSIRKDYDDSNVKKESGLIRIRFIVNCQGETDRFRMIQSDLDYKEKVFDEKITHQLMTITKSLDKWGQKIKEDGTPVDYWQYLIFKIVDGKIVKIIP